MTHPTAIPIVLLALLAVGCPPSSPPKPAPTEAEALTIPGLENVYRVTPNLYSGGTPVEDAAFAELQKLGVKTILSVDGAETDVERAAKHGMKYVHIPVGYDGIPQTVALRLAKAVQSMTGPVYIHCHHGKHRGPAAVAAVRLCLEPDFSPALAHDWLKKAGTSPDYQGLIRLPNTLQRPTPEQLATIPTEFPSNVKAKDLTRAMVHIDEYWETIVAGKKRNWLGADSAATLLAEEYLEARRSLKASTKGETFSNLIVEAEKTARDLAAAIKAGKTDVAQAHFDKSKTYCLRCHKEFRD